ncbi:MAG TPA: sulfotransferase domain-containing protein [Rhizomicrobium sp.]|nr:sulfotransferase domain-containing protein [Rhizomicrobium sp.]
MAATDDDAGLAQTGDSAVEERAATEETSATEAGGRPPPKGILWLASYPKSGNTWTRTFLHNLLKILEGEEDAQDINEMNEFTTWEISARAYETHLGKPPKDCDREEIAKVRPKVQEEIAERTDGLALIKTHHALVMDRGVPTINFAVSSGAVYILRNPLDVAISFSHHMSSTIDHAIDEMAMVGLETAVTDKSVYEIYGSWSQHVESWTHKPHRTIYVMRYEDMIANPFRAFGGLARHLLLRPTAEQLGKAIERASFKNLQQQEAKGGFREKPEKAEKFFREGKTGEWREKLNRRQIRRIVQAHHEQMRRFGYITDEVAHLAP